MDLNCRKARKRFPCREEVYFENGKYEKKASSFRFKARHSYIIHPI
jgi:hypothetical protein